MKPEQKTKPKSLLRRKEFIFETLNGEEGTYQKSKGVKVETIGFYLRFIGQHYQPCDKCSEEIASLLQNSNWDLGSDSTSVSLQRLAKGIFQFELPFLLVKGEYHVTEKFIPCEQCQKQIEEMINTAENLTIGNKEYAFPVELWKKYEIDDDAWIELEKRPSTPEEKVSFADQHLWFT